MASKLEKAQYQYEALLRDLGEKSELIGAHESADPALLKNYRRAKESLSDRQLELDFLDSEIEGLVEKEGVAKEEIEKRIEELKVLMKEKEEIIDVKRSKANPLRSKLAGAEYDLKFVEKGLEDEKRKAEEKQKREEFKKAKEHLENVKRLKIEVLKRKKTLVDMKREIKEYEGPAKAMEREVDGFKDEVKKLEEQLVVLDRDQADGLKEELERQQAAKRKEVERAQLHLKDVLADVGEDLYERRVKNPVLDKYYADLDAVAATIDKLQE
jgi:chromosome segregation ATPase